MQHRLRCHRTFDRYIGEVGLWLLVRMCIAASLMSCRLRNVNDMSQRALFLERRSRNCFAFVLIGSLLGKKSFR